MKLSRDSASARELDRLVGREEATLALADIKSSLQDFVDAGGTTGFFTGTKEQIARKIGLTTDIQLASLATRVEFAIQAYRQAISGAAFTEAEKVEYRAIYPSIGNIPELNNALIDTLQDVNGKFIDAFYNRQLGTSNYNQVKNMLESPNPKDIVFPNQSFNSVPEMLASFPNMLSIVEGLVDIDSNISDIEILQEIELRSMGGAISTAGFRQGGGGTPTAVVTGKISGLSAFDTFNAHPGVNRSDRNNNPGNIKVSSFTKQFEGVAGVESKPAEDGGNFLIFASTQDGINAVGRLLDTASPYQGVTAERAIKRYNGNGGYGATDVGLDPNKDFQSQISDPNVLRQVVDRIMKLEGFTGINTNLA